MVKKLMNYMMIHQYQRRNTNNLLWLISVTQHSVFEEVGADFESFLNQANKERNIYEIFEEHLISEGEIRWRLHEDCKDVLLMNNYNHTTGYMMPDRFCPCNLHKRTKQ